jgi:hypothetical protein
MADEGGSAMEKIVAVALVLTVVVCGCVSTSEPAPSDSYQQIVTLQKDKQEIFNLSMQWMAKSFVSSKAVIEYSDKDTGVIMGNGIALVDVGALSGKSPIKFMIEIEVKDRKSRLTFSKMKRDYSDLSTGDSGDALAKSILEGRGFTKFEYNRFVKFADDALNNYSEYINTTSANW